MDSSDYAELLARAVALRYAAEQLTEVAQEARAHQVFNDPERLSKAVISRSYFELKAIATDLERRALEIERALY